MDFKMLFVSTLLLLIKVILVCCDTRSKMFGFMRPRSIIKEVYITDKVMSSSLVSCATLCSVIKECFTISFNSVTLECLYSDRELIHGTPSGYFAQESGWTSISKKEYTVYLRQGPSGHYTLTWSQAVELCKRENTTIASEADLMASRALGFGICGCGWLSSGRGGFVMHRDKYRGCSGQPFTTGIFKCEYLKMNVFCLIKDHH